MVKFEITTAPSEPHHEADAAEMETAMSSPSHDPSDPPFGQTHEVTNQPPPLCDYDAFATDHALTAALAREGAGWHAEALSRDARALTQPDVLALADLANRHTPELNTHDARGERIDEIEFHPAWHELLRRLRQEGLQALPFEADARAGSMAARCAGYFLHGQLESGSLCPITMTFASIPILRNEPALFSRLSAQLLSREHDPRDIPLDAGKRSMMIGMGMTEKQPHARARHRCGRAWRCLSADRTQVVLFRAAMRCPSGAGAHGGRRRFVVLLRAAFRTGRPQERRTDSASEGQTRQSLECEQRSRIFRCLGCDDR